jgi:hypothetical protein
MQLEATEFAIEIKNDDYTVVKQAFDAMKNAIDAWDTQEAPYYPVDLVCEMRFTAGSEATLVSC